MFDDFDHSYTVFTWFSYKLKCTFIFFSALVALKSIMPDDEYAAEAREVYSAIKSTGIEFEANKAASSKRIAELEEDMKSKRSAPKKIKAEVIKPEPVKKSIFFGTGLMSPKPKISTDQSVTPASAPTASSLSSSSA